jgi:hypothetical protein
VDRLDDALEGNARPHAERAGAVDRPGVDEEECGLITAIR